MDMDMDAQFHIHGKPARMTLITPRCRHAVHGPRKHYRVQTAVYQQFGLCPQDSFSSFYSMTTQQTSPPVTSDHLFCKYNYRATLQNLYWHL